MTISKHIKMIHFVVIVLTLLFFTGIQSVEAAVNAPDASFTVRDFGGLSTDDTPGVGGFYGRIDGKVFVSEHFFEFDISSIDVSYTAFLGFDLFNNTTEDLTHGLSHDISLAYYTGTGLTDTSFFGIGTPIDTYTLPTGGINSFSVNVTDIFRDFRNSGDDYLGFSLYNAVWSDDDTGDQIRYVDSSLTVVPEPVSTILFIIGGVVLGGRGLLRRKKQEVI